MTKPYLICQSPKEAEALTEIAGHNYIVFSMDDFQRFPETKGSSVLICPNATTQSIKLLSIVATNLKPGASELKMIDLSDIVDVGGGWSPVDAKADGWDWKQFYEWAKKRVKPFEIKVSFEIPDEDPPITQSQAAIISDLGLACTDKGKPILDIRNVVLILERSEEFKSFVWYDDFHKNIFTSKGAWDESDTLQLTFKLQKVYGMSRLSDDIVRKAIVIYAQNNQRNEPRDWMESLRWDGVERLHQFFSDYLGAEKSAYSSAVGVNLFTALAARIYKPGCKFDCMIILEGTQGSFKTQAVNLIGGPWYAEATTSVMDKDFMLGAQGKLIMELAELDSLRNAENTKIKSIMSRREDVFRVPYGRYFQKFPRTCVFIATTNESTYLKDNTGARRFWPIKCGKIDLEAIKRDREQLFAEGVSYFKVGNPWWLMPEEETLKIQEARRQDDEWEDIIEDYLIGKDDTRIKDIADHLGIPNAKLDKLIQRRIGAILRRIGWDKRNRRDIYGNQRKLWVNCATYSDEVALKHE